MNEQTIVPREHCGNLMPSWGSGPRSECVLRPGHSGSHADDRGARWWEDAGDGDRDKRVLADEVTRLAAITGQLRALAGRWQATVRPGEQHPAAAAILNIIDGDGPSVREAAEADRAHWTDKYAGEGP